MPINVMLPEVYDNFRSEYIIPRQCRLDPPLDTSIGFRATTEERVIEIPEVGLKMLGMDNYIRLPIVPNPDPATVDVLFEYYKTEGGVLETLENLKIPVRTSGSSWIQTGQQITPDSMFVRMNLGLTSVMDEVRKSKVMEGVIGFKKDTFDPEAKDIARISDTVFRYLAQLDEGEMKKDGGLVYVSTIVDAAETKKANLYTKGLLYCHIAYHLGLSPIMAIGDGKCIVGAKSSALDIYESEFSLRKTKVAVKDDDRYSLGDVDGKYLLFDLDFLTDMNKSVESAGSLWNKMAPENICCVQYEIEKNDSISMLEGN